MNQSLENSRLLLMPHRLALLTLCFLTMLVGCDQRTPEEKLEAATQAGTKASGFYPRCKPWTEREDLPCNDLRRNVGPGNADSVNYPLAGIAINESGRELSAYGLKGATFFLNSVTYTPGGSLVAVGGPGLTIARAESESSDTWRVQRFSSFADVLRDVQFVDADNGLAVGYRGIIFRTQDGGDSWHVFNETYREIDSPVLQLRTEGEAYAVAYIDQKTAVSGGNERILRTQSGAQHWQPVSAEIPDLQAIQEIAFIDGERGWAVGTSGTTLYTEDAGETWKSVSIIDTTRHVLGLDFTGERGCVAAGWQVWCTQDGGQRWQESQVEAPDSTSADDEIGVTRLRLAGDTSGWFVTQHGWIYETRDGGRTWHPWMNVANAADGALTSPSLWGLTIGDDSVWAVGQGMIDDSPVSTDENGTLVYDLSSSPLILRWRR